MAIYIGKSSSAISRSILDLELELSTLQPEGCPALVFTHDGSNIIVYAKMSVRAFVPKKYKGFGVTLRDWSDRPQTDLSKCKKIGLDDVISATEEEED
jgi:hypothetical protein